MADKTMMMGPEGAALLGFTIHVGQHEQSSGCGVEPRCRPVGMNRPESPRASALNEARDLITGDRNAQYGPPTQDFQRAAELLQACGFRRVDAEDIVHDIVSSDVALIIAQVKVSRLMHSRDKRDSWVDLAGYAACGYECAVEEAKGEDA